VLVTLAGCAPNREEQAVLDRPPKVAMSFGAYLRLPDPDRQCVRRPGVHACPDGWPIRGIIPVARPQTASCVYTPNGAPPATELDENGVPQSEITVCCVLTYTQARTQNDCSR